MESVHGMINNFKSNQNTKSRRKILATSNPSKLDLHEQVREHNQMSNGSLITNAECGKHAD